MTVVSVLLMFGCVLQEIRIFLNHLTAQATEGTGPWKTMALIAVSSILLATPAHAAKPDPRPHGDQPQFAGHRHGNQNWQWNWQVWLPDKWARIGACETGYGQRPGRWDWNSGTYQGAFGFHRSSWDQFKPVSWWPDEAYEATPFQQYQVALRIYARYGLSGWGCRNA